MTDFTAFVKEYEKMVYNLCLRSCNNPEDAFDLSQDVFIKAWRGLPSFRGDSSHSTWLYRLVLNVCADFARKKSRRKETVPLDSVELTLSDERYEPAAALEKKELVKNLQNGLERLAPEHRHILMLRETAGLSYKEISETLDLEEGTVKSRIARARIALREILIESGNNYGLGASKKTKK